MNILNSQKTVEKLTQKGMNIYNELYWTKLMEKLKESLEAVVPIIVIVLILSFTIAPVPPGILMAFIIGAILLIVGMMFFTLGAEMSMTPMGERIGTRIAQSYNIVDFMRTSQQTR